VFCWRWWLGTGTADIRVKTGHMLGIMNCPLSSRQLK